MMQHFLLLKFPRIFSPLLFSFLMAVAGLQNLQVQVTHSLGVIFTLQCYSSIFVTFLQPFPSYFFLLPFFNIFLCFFSSSNLEIVSPYKNLTNVYCIINIRTGILQQHDFFQFLNSHTNSSFNKSANIPINRPI